MYNYFTFIHINNGDIMDIDIRKFIIGNFKEDTIEDIRNSIDTSISSKEEDPLLGLGVLFELTWNNSDEETKYTILKNIKKGITN